MSNFIKPLGSLPANSRKRRVFNPSTLTRPNELSTEQQYNKATSEEERTALYHRAVEESEREKARDRMFVC
jgi:hypothetical protein